MIYVELGWTLSMRIQVLRGSFFCSNINKIEEIDYSESEEEKLVPDPNNNSQNPPHTPAKKTLKILDSSSIASADGHK